MTRPSLERSIDRLQSVQDIANLQGRYMFYLEAHRYPELLALFALDDADVSVEIGEGGVYVGRSKVEALFLQVLKPFFMLPGMMPLHMLTTPVIEVDADGSTARGMWQTLGCNSFPSESGLRAVWQQGYYDNEYVRVNERWRIKKMCWQANFRTSFDRGWVEEPLYRLQPLDWASFPPALRPDRAGGENHEAYSPTAVRHHAPVPPEPAMGG